MLLAPPSPPVVVTELTTPAPVPVPGPIPEWSTDESLSLSLSSSSTKWESGSSRRGKDGREEESKQMIKRVCREGRSIT